MKFKVGDKVKAICDWGRVVTGGIYTISEVVVPLDQVQIFEFPDVRYQANRFELVKEPMTNKTELEVLVEQANKGAEAEKKLIELFPNDVESRVNHRADWSVHAPKVKKDNYCPYEYRVKPKPTFEPFNVGKAWPVSLKGDRLHIGCKDFDAKSFKQMITHMTNGGYEYLVKECYSFRAFRAGIMLIEISYPLISWEDADKILAALEKAGV